MNNFYVAEKMMEWKSKEMEQYYTINEQKSNFHFSSLLSLLRFDQKNQPACCQCC